MVVPTLAHGRGRLVTVGVFLLLAGFLAVGLAGTGRYIWNYWLYRGFPPPRDPAFVTAHGSTQRLYVASGALGGRLQPVDVYLPPGYNMHPARRYPVLYLLHGVAGRPGAFLQTVRAGVVEDILIAKRRLKPMILVMPFGSTGSFTDEEWANGVRPSSGWEDFVARDLVRAIDARYRTLPAGAGRGIGGLSEGGYGAINIALHHPGEFRVVESWSGYERAADLRTIFGHRPALLRWNSPLERLPFVAARLRAARTYLWFYSGTDDRLRWQNRDFDTLLTHARISHRFYLVRGGHNWALWRGQAFRALLAASRRLRA
jgi:enterochelin esterase-like enzyme